MLAEPEVNQAAAVVDQCAGVGGEGIESFLSQLLLAGELVALVGGALLERQGYPRTKQRSQDGYAAGDDGLHTPS